MLFLAKKKIEKTSDNHSDPLEEIWKNIRMDYPIKNYILRENLPEQLVPQIELIKATIKSEEDFSKAFYSYITFHQIYFHLKNYILLLKKKKFGYGIEFLDLFEDIFIDNFIIFKHLVNHYLSSEYMPYLNIWLDGFFLSLFNKTIDEDKKSKYNRVQPQLFFVAILFLALPKISNFFKESPFVSVLKFQETTQSIWNSSLPLLDNLEFSKPYSENSIITEKQFIYRFMHLDAQFNKSTNRFYFEEESRLKCMNILHLLIEKTPEIIKNITNIRFGYNLVVKN